MYLQDRHSAIELSARYGVVHHRFHPFRRFREKFVCGRKVGEDFAPNGWVESEETVFIIGDGADLFKQIGDGRRRRRVVVIRMVVGVDEFGDGHREENAGYTLFLW